MGASLAGMFAARVLADHVERVTLLDHADLPEDPEPRRGVGQSHHSHVLLDAGLEVVEDLFPGVTSELETFGAGISDAGTDMRWFQHGCWKPRFKSEVRLFWSDRPKLEWAIRRRLQERSNIEFVSGRKIVNYIDSGDGRVSGVEAKVTEDGSTERWPAELVVDATGRGSRTPQLLEEMGYPEPPTRSYNVDLGYTSCKVTHPETYNKSWKTLAIFPRMPETTKMGVAYPVDDERFHITLVGWCGDHPPVDDEGFQQFAEDLPSPAMGKLLSETERLTKLRRYNTPQPTWRRYDKMEDWPAGLVVVGDAVCGFNPVYGQGMTVCAKEASALKSMLEDRAARGELGVPSDSRFGKAFQRKAARYIRTPWLLAASQDYQYPEVTGDEWLPRKLGSVIERVVDASGEYAEVHRAFLEVLSLKYSPAQFLQPKVSGRVLSSAVGDWVDRHLAASSSAAEDRSI